MGKCLKQRHIDRTAVSVIFSFLVFGFVSYFGFRISDLAFADSLSWRGDGTGRYTEANPPIKWSSKNNILWQTEVGKGQSTPVIVGKKIFVTSEEDKLVCIDRDTGAILWSKENGYATLPP